MVQDAKYPLKAKYQMSQDKAKNQMPSNAPFHDVKKPFHGVKFSIRI